MPKPNPRRPDEALQQELRAILAWLDDHDPSKSRRAAADPEHEAQRRNGDIIQAQIEYERLQMLPVLQRETIKFFETEVVRAFRETIMSIDPADFTNKQTNWRISISGNCCININPDRS